ncbi:MAG: bestrophin family protein [Cyclobacteriaceae bacterium]
MGAYTDDSGKEKSVWFAIIFDFHRTKTLKRLSYSMVLVGLYAFTVDYIESEMLHVDFKPPSYVFSMLGIVLGILLVFRTNTAYDRWWEGRKLVSKLGYTWKNVAIKLNAFLPETDYENRKYFSAMISNHSYSLKESLRDSIKPEELIEAEPGLLNNLTRIYHIPNFFLTKVCFRFNQLYKTGVITDMQFLEISKHIDDISEVVSSCERIHSSPIPFSYAIHLKKFLFAFVLILPFGFIHDLGYWSALIVMLIFYAMVGLDVIGEEIEDPFGQDENDLPFDSLCYSIKKNVNEILKVK